MKSLALFGLLLFLFGCSDQESEIKSTDLSKYNMKIIPSEPTSSDEIKLVEFDNCTYNILSGVTRTDKTISIQKQFNSMMKLPCVMKNDTILIGRLPAGTYTVNYKLLDISSRMDDPTVLSFSFGLSVSR